MANNVKQVRLLIPDLGSGAEQILTDTEIIELLDLWGGNPMRAAASALLAISTDTAKLLKLSTDDLSVDGSSPAGQVRENARLLFLEADKADNRSADEAFTVVYPVGEMNLTPEATAHMVHPWVNDISFSL